MGTQTYKRNCMNKKLGLVTGLLSLSVFYKLTFREVHDKMKIKFGNQWNGTEDEHCYELEFWQTSTSLHAKISAKFFNDPPPSVPEGYMMGLWDYEETSGLVLRKCQLSTFPMGSISSMLMAYAVLTTNERTIQCSPYLVMIPISTAFDTLGPLSNNYEIVDII